MHLNKIPTSWRATLYFGQSKTMLQGPALALTRRDQSLSFCTSFTLAVAGESRWNAMVSACRGCPRSPHRRGEAPQCTAPAGPPLVALHHCSSLQEIWGAAPLHPPTVSPSWVGGEMLCPLKGMWLLHGEGEGINTTGPPSYG